MSDKQLLKLLKSANKAAGDPGRTAKELATELFGSGSTGMLERVRERLRPEIQAGRVVAGRGLRQNICGVWHPEPVYRVVET